MLGFPLSKMGGVMTFTKNLRYGFKQLGHTVGCYAITLNKKTKPKNNDYGFNNVLGFETNEWLKEYEKTVNEYDLIIFIHQCPHLLKSYTSTNWEKCYSLIKNKPILSWVHDGYYKKYYPWFKNIPLKYNVKIVCPSKHKYNAIKDLQGMKTIINLPIIFKNSGVYTEKKKNIVVDHNNWKSVKHKELLLDYAKEIQAKIISYGDETSFDFRRMKKFHQNFNSIIHKGWCGKKEIYEDLKTAKVFTDFAKYGNQGIWDYAIMEAIAHGCIPVMQSEVDKDNNIFYIKVNSHNQIPIAINKVLKNFKQYKASIEKNLELLKTLDPIKIAKEVIEYSKLQYKITKNHNWW